MTPKTWSILAIRLIVVYLLLASVSSIGFAIYGIVVFDRSEIPGAVYQLIIPASYFIVLLVLLTYAEPIAARISKGLGESNTKITWTKTELLSVIIAGISAFVILSAIPTLVNQLYSILEYDRNMSSHYPESERFNRLFLGIMGSLAQISVAVWSLYRAKRIASLWEQWQSSAASPAVPANEMPGRPATPPRSSVTRKNSGQATRRVRRVR